MSSVKMVRRNERSPFRALKHSAEKNFFTKISSVEMKEARLGR